MTLIRDLETLPERFRGGAVAIGNFDGVHLGHAKLVEQLRQRAESIGGPALVFTFDPHPAWLLRPDRAPPPLTWTDRKAALLAELGVDATIAFPTDEALLALAPDKFFEQIVLRQLSAGALVEGPNFFFGRDRAGNVDLLADLCRRHEIALDIVQPLVADDEIVSSSRIRASLRNGDVETARHLLARPYRVRGMVTHGARRGAAIGFPTANISAIDTLVPGNGVYAGRTYFNGQSWASAIHIGPNPTFGEQSTKFEVHLIGYDGSLYGQAVEVDFFTRLRDIRSFDSAEQLSQQLKHDVDAARQVAVERRNVDGSVA